MRADADLHYRRGNELRMAGRVVEAEVALRAALALAPEHGEAALSLAFLLREQGRLHAASEVILARWQALPRTREGDLRALAFLRECQQPQAAEVIIVAALDLFKDDAALLALAGDNALDRGEFASARERLAGAVERDPFRAPAWLRLAHTHRFESSDDTDFLRMRAAYAAARGGDDVQSALCFALGKAHDDLGDFAAAAAFWREGNTRAKRHRAGSRESWSGYIEQQLDMRSMPVLQERHDFSPVFVLGLPRTGTTLVATLLDRHPAVRNRGELNWLSALATHIGPSPTPAALDAAVSLYRAQLRQDDAPARFFLDKNPLNFRYLGLIAAMFPKARVIHCRRSRRDTVLSIWSQHFAHDDLGWSYDFSDIAAFATIYETLVANRPTSLAWFDLSYERLVAHPDVTLAELHAFLGLEAVDVNAGTTGTIRTASVWQARQPLHARSVGRWRDYANWIPELARFSN